MPRILIIEDESLSARSLTAILQSEGFDVKSTAFGKEGLQWLKEGFDLVILDMKLPDLNGIEVLRVIKRKYAQVGVILITAYASVETAVAAMNEGAFTYITKPFEVDDLLKAINDALKQRRVQDQQVRILSNLSLLYQMSKEMEGVIELYSISVLAATYFLDVVKLKVCAILLIDETTNEFFFSALRGVKCDISKLAEKRFELDKKMYERLIKDHNAILISELQSKPAILKYIPVPDIRSLFIFPLIAKNKVVGLAVFLSNQSVVLSDEDLETISTISTEIALCIENANHYLKLKQNYLETVTALVKAIEDKTRYTKGHSEAVAELAANTARNMNLSSEEVKLIKYAGLLHDIGKVALSEQIVLKKEKLTVEEHVKLKMHSIISTSIVRRIDTENKLVSIILHHHERFDGSGYPHGLKGEMIPISARILSVCDAYTAMIADRPYRQALTKEEALYELRRCADTQFDPQVVKVFIEQFK